MNCSRALDLHFDTSEAAQCHIWSCWADYISQFSIFVLHLFFSKCFKHVRAVNPELLPRTPSAGVGIHPGLDSPCTNTFDLKKTSQHVSWRCLGSTLRLWGISTICCTNVKIMQCQNATCNTAGHWSSDAKPVTAALNDLGFIFKEAEFKHSSKLAICF